MKLSNDQQQQLRKVRDENRDDMFNDGMEDLQNVGAQEEAKKIDDIIARQDKKLLAVLTDEQRAQLDKIKGDKIELDLTKLPSPIAG